MKKKHRENHKMQIETTGKGSYHFGNATQRAFGQRMIGLGSHGSQIKA
jgi:hypothetical protein